MNCENKVKEKPEKEKSQGEGGGRSGLVVALGEGGHVDGEFFWRLGQELNF